MGTIGEEIQQKKFSSEYHKMTLNIVYTGNWITSINGERLKKHQLTPPQFNILRILRGQHPGPATVNLLIERMLDKMSNASRLVDKLKTKGLVERRTSENDRRACDVVITKKGLDVLVKIDKEQEEWEDSFSNITKAEAKELNRLLDKLRG
ncbi:MAG: MarR family transcriptional regulator [Bacteroidota bacterium]